jgi:hypothetical protein
VAAVEEARGRIHCVEDFAGKRHIYPPDAEGA